MPTTYAHWRFGQHCLQALPEPLQKPIRAHRNIFDFGVHGPDIFFYYHCLKPNAMNAYGNALHDRSYRSLLESWKPHFTNVDDPEAALAYIYGVTCHFVLDSYCHGYIERKEECSSVSHAKIESQFDRYLLKKDGKDPVKSSVTFSLKPSKEIAHVLAQLYTQWSEKDLFQTIKDQKMYLDLLKDSNRIKRFFLSKGMDLVHASNFKDLMITEVDEPLCQDSNLRLHKLFDQAVEHAPSLMQDVRVYLLGLDDLPPYFDHTFGPKDDYKQIPVLSLEEEQSFKVDGFQK